MRNYRKLKETLHEGESQVRSGIDNINVMAKDAERVSIVAKDVHIIIKDIDKQFSEKTKLSGIDITFLFLATALQCARQYFFTNFKERTDDKTAAKPFKKKEEDKFGKETRIQKKERMDSTHNWYHPSLEEVTHNPVPFDQAAAKANLNLHIGGGFKHRASTLGHDPVLGWVVGTANIATSTLTTWEGKSYHVKYNPISNGVLKPMNVNHARTDLVFDHTFNRLFNEGPEGKTIFGIALFREAMHLKSDEYSKVSLPIPFTSLISPDFAKKLADIGIDSANVGTIGKQIAWATMINTIISIVHSFFYDEIRDGKISLYQVRTRKILSYSNVIASVSNLIVVTIGSAIGIASENPDQIKKSLSYLDIGGIIVTLHRIISDYNFIKQIKQEFLEKEFYNIVMGDEYNF
ncbi:hypothetical protein AGMMS49546_32780 [Spirochaetia bacterium]|nr:hypothetical protein AGMMS49546_32780 [Spirochaetia bacterium]